MPALVRRVSELAYSDKFWPRLLDNEGVKLGILKRMLTAIALDEAVTRTERVVKGVPALMDTWGSQEEQGAITLELQVRRQGSAVDSASIC